MEIIRAEMNPSAKGPADWFTGTVRVAPCWHRAGSQTAMTHIAVQESLDGKAVDWLQHVTDEEYGNTHGGKND